MPRTNRPTNKSKRTKSKKVQDPRVALFRTFYIDPTSETFANCRASAMKAGYSETYADNITVQMPKWLEELLEDDAMMRADMLKRAQKNIKSVVEEPKPTEVREKQLWFKASEYISGTLGKDHYSTRQELTDANGRKLFTNTTKDTADIAIADLFKPTPQSSDV